MIKNTSPKLILTWVSILSIVLVALSAFMALKQPVMGVHFESPDLSQNIQPHIIVTSVDSDSSADKAGLTSGVKLVAISDGQSGWFDFKSTDVMEEPDMLPSYDAYFKFLQRQQSIYSLLQSNTIQLKADDGNIYSINVSQRHLSQLPFIYWFQVLCGLIAMLTGFSVYVFRKNDPASLQFAINGFSFLIITLAASVYSSRELALAGGDFYALNVLNHVGSLVFSASFVSLFLLYPNRLFRQSWHWLVLIVYLVFALCDAKAIFASHDESIRLPIMLALSTSIILAFIQRYKSRNSLVEKAALRWFTLSLLIGGGLFVTITIFQSFIGQHSEIPQGYSLGFILIMYIGIAFGITRYKLFQLERWWFSIWLWLLGGALLLLSDAIFSYVLGLNESFTIAITLAIIGWLYFPFRQWLATKIFFRNNLRLQDVFPQVLSLLVSSNQSQVMTVKWKKLLEELFQPLQTQEITTQCLNVELDTYGETLTVPSIQPQLVYKLSYPNKGKRFFSKRDYKLVTGLWELLSHALEEKNAYEKGTLEERKRISRDLHDDIGTRLLTLIHKTEDQSLATLAKDAMRDLRQVLSSLDEKPRYLIDALGDWRGELEERCALQEVELEWNQNDFDETLQISSRQFINLQRVIRETITNALRHSSPTWIRISIEVEKQIKVEIKHNGCSDSIEQWKKGRGLNNIDHRIKELSGTIIRKQHQDEITTEIHLPI